MIKLNALFHELRGLGSLTILQFRYESYCTVGLFKKMEKKKTRDFKKELEKCEKEKEEYLAGWQRARADFLNYKKDETERTQQALRGQNEDLILEILLVLDSFERAEEGVEKEKDNKFIKGFLQIKAQLQGFLNYQKVEEIEAVGKKFDPSFHEAIAEVENAKEESGIVIEELQKGYMLNGKVLRPAKVKISK